MVNKKSNHIALTNVPEEIAQFTEIQSDELSNGKGVNISHFRINPNYQNQGYGTKALEGVIKYYKNNTNKEYIAINIGTNNIGSEKVAEWLEGFGFNINECKNDHVDGILEI